MYETEAHLRTESSSQIAPEVLSAFGELSGRIISRTLISWGEHCTECGWPTCYSTCDLYSPREDLKCRRFVDGMVRVNCAESLNQYLLKIRFKRWGKLWARGNLQMHPIDRAERLEQRDYSIGMALQRLPLPNELRRRVTEKRYALKKRLASRYPPQDHSPTSFVLECYNPNTETVSLSLRIRSLHSSHSFPNLIQLIPGLRQAHELTESAIAFEKLITVPSGFHRTSIPFAHIEQKIDPHAPFCIDLTPNEVTDGATLYFGTMDFIREVPAQTPSPKTIKCVVWDLDNTLWNGTLTEDGSENLTLKPGMVGVIEELDRRGILQSIASKNNPEEALEVIRRFRLDTYFLYPQISWQPKSGGVKALAQSLNIAMDSVLFVDDSDFELQEVHAACTGVRTMLAGEYLVLPEREECQVPVTPESTSRREMYQVEAQRRVAAQDFGQDYLAFLRDCRIKVTIAPLTEANLERVHELTQRTNQLNFSGNRYCRDVLRTVRATPYLDTYVLECNDRFGSYGVVGFSIVDRREPRMTDLMFSCRIQSKRIEHAFLGQIIRRYVGDSDRDFLANYRRTVHNAPAGRVFADIGMKEIEEGNGATTWVLPRHQVLVEDGIVDIEFAGAGADPGSSSAPPELVGSPDMSNVDTSIGN